MFRGEDDQNYCGCGSIYSTNHWLKKLIKLKSNGDEHGERNFGSQNMDTKKLKLKKDWQ